MALSFERVRCSVPILQYHSWPSKCLSLAASPRFLQFQYRHKYVDYVVWGTQGLSHGPQFGALVEARPPHVVTPGDVPCGVGCGAPLVCVLGPGFGLALQLVLRHTIQMWVEVLRQGLQNSWLPRAFAAQIWPWYNLEGLKVWLCSLLRAL